MLAAPHRLRVESPAAAVAPAVAGLAAAAAGLTVPLTGRPQWVLLAVVAVVALALVTWRLELGLWAFVLATALNRYNFAVAGWQMKVEHMVLLLVLAAWGLRLLSNRERLERWPLMAFVAAFLGLGLVASVLQSPDLYKSVRILTRMGLAVAAYVLIVNYVSDRERLWRLVTVCLGVAAGAAVFGIAAAVAWGAAGVNLGVQHNSITGTWHPYGTLWEANIFGAYVMAAAVTALVLLVSRQRVINRWFLSLVLAATAVAMMLSLARASWLGFGVAALCMLVFIGKLRFQSVVAVGLAAAVAVLVLARLDPGGVAGDVQARVGTIQTASQDINFHSRLTNSELALREWRESRWLGWGIDGFHIRHPEVLSALPSPQLNALYDTGLLGAAAFVLLLLAVVGRAFAAALTSGDGPEKALVLALLFSFGGLLMAYQATDAFWLGFTWVHIGLLTAASLALERPRAPKYGRAS